MIEIKECLGDAYTYYLNLLNVDFVNGSSRIEKDYESGVISDDLYKSLERHIKFRKQLISFRFKCRIGSCKTLEEVDLIHNELKSSFNELGLTQDFVDSIVCVCDKQKRIILLRKELEGYLDGFKKVS